jgi:hypothetical protein
VASAQVPLRADETQSGAIPLPAEIQLPDTIPKGRYQVLLSVLQEGSASQLQPIQLVTRDPATTPVKIGDIVVRSR